MSTHLKVAVLQGGDSSEAEVSRNSAAQVANALVAAGHQVSLVELDGNCASSLLELQPEVVFPALHGPPGEDGTVQGFLEMLHLPYVGSGVRGSALAMDKALAKYVFRRADLPVLQDRVVEVGTNLDTAAADILATLGAAVVIKPLNQGSAIGVTPMPNGGDIRAALEAALVYGACMVEPFIVGREITVGVLEITGEGGAPQLQPHPVIEILTQQDEWYDYTNRYAAGKSEHVIPAPLSEACTRQLQNIALIAHAQLGLRDLSRADFMVTDNEEIYLLEVNSLPGMTPTSLYPDGARHLGYSFEQLMDLLVRQAARRA